MTSALEDILSLIDTRVGRLVEMDHPCAEMALAELRGLRAEVEQLGSETKPEQQQVGVIAWCGDAIATTMADLITPKQLVAVRAIANARRLNADSVCLELLKCTPEELRRRAASALIDYL